MFPRLPVGNYTIKIDPFDNFYLESVDSFEISGKVYGDTQQNAARMINTFQDRVNSTGVLLAGEKGSGKSLLAKLISIECAKLDIPTIIINTDWCGDKFNTFIQSIDQPAVILFDEFEKVYDRDKQPAILTLLDGVFPTKKLFVLTCNDKWRIDEHMHNRPGRLYYSLTFYGLSVEFIEEYCNENLINKSEIASVCRISGLFTEFNFDMLKAMIEEMNRYNEPAQKVIKLLNTKPRESGGAEYTITLKVDGKLIPQEQLRPNPYEGNPLSRDTFTIVQLISAQSTPRNTPRNTSQGAYAIARALDDDQDCSPEDHGDASQIVHKFNYTNLKDVNASNHSLIYVNKQGVEATFTKVVKQEFFYAF